MRRIRHSVLVMAVIVPMVGIAACSGTGSSAGLTETVTVPTTVIITTGVASTVTQTVTEAAGPAPSTTEMTTASGTSSADAVIPATFEPRAGFMAKAIGQRAGLGDPDSDHLGVSFWITQITPGITCTSSGAQEPQHGQFLGIELTVDVPESFDAAVNAGLDLDAPNFIVIGPGDTSADDPATSAAQTCMDHSDRIGPVLNIAGARSSGWVVMDTDVDHGSLLLTQLSMGYGGWEWRF